jgi:hypothetical protein
MSAGELFEIIRPTVIIISALTSAWIFASARKRFPFYVAIAWAGATLFLPLIAFPLYLAVIVLGRRSPRKRVRWRVALPLIYAAIVLCAISIYLYLDHGSVDAHLARATQARIAEDRATTIRELQEALAIEDNPHIHKLLGNEFTEAGFWSDAISELRLAEEGGEPDDSIHFQLGLLLEHLNQTGQAQLEFQSFLFSETCEGIDPRCEAARQKVEAANR